MIPEFRSRRMPPRDSVECFYPNRYGFTTLWALWAAMNFVSNGVPGVAMKCSACGAGEALDERSTDTTAVRGIERAQLPVLGLSSNSTATDVQPPQNAQPWPLIRSCMVSAKSAIEEELRPI
jgi:hypothetical protein